MRPEVVQWFGTRAVSTAARHDPAVWRPDEPVRVLLDQWVLDDSNYAGFVTGTVRKFAVVFDVTKTRTLRHDPDGTGGCRYLGTAADYAITADVAH